MKRSSNTTSTRHRYHLALVLNLASIIALAGCGSSDSDYLPSTTAARAALEASLNKWKAGDSLAAISTGPVPVETFDARWRDGNKLESFEILRETLVEGRPTFDVKTKLADAAEPIEDTFIVVGNNPLLVFRKQDYDKAGGTGGG